MSMGSSSGSNNSFDAEELSQIQTRCIQLRKEKDLLRESQSQSFELIRRLEQHVKKLSEARAEDKEQMAKLERELSNCSQEIDYLQDQLNARNNEVNCLGDHAQSLELKVTDMENLEAMVGSLREELKRSDTEHLFLVQELENKELELKNSRLRIEKLEEKLSLVRLEYQCEVESMKLDLMSFEQSFFEADKIEEGSTEEKASIDGMIKNLEFQIKEAQNVIKCLDEENKELREKLDTSERNARLFCQKMEHQFPDWLENKDAQSSSSEPEKDTSICGEILGPLLSKLVNTRRGPDADLKDKMENMSCQIREYELLVRQLKEELRDEKLKAKEEAEDLAQEMAELRYQITGLLEEECKRRACIEQISLQRIAKLEAQIEKERCKSFNDARHICEE
ncbi:hypothetical protein LguiA_028289 [Lonicera macranthoides]